MKTYTSVSSYLQRPRSFAGAGHLRFDLASYPGRLADVETLRGTSGWVRVAKLRLVTPAITREHLVLSVIADNGESPHPDTIERLMAVPAYDLGQASVAIPDSELTTIEAERRKALLALAEEQNEAWLDAENDKLDAYAEDLERAFEAEVKATEAEIKAAKKELRGSTLLMSEKLAEKQRIGTLEAKRDKIKAEFFDRRAQIRAEVEAMLDKIEESLKLAPTLTPLFTVRWEVT